MPGTTLEDLQRKYPPADREEYDRARAAAELAGAVAELVYGMRSKAGFTQAELAVRMGTTQSSVARMESGGSLPTIEMLARLAHATGVPVRLEAPGVADIEILAGHRRSRVATRTGGRPASKRRVPAGLIGDPVGRERGPSADAPNASVRQGLASNFAGAVAAFGSAKLRDVSGLSVKVI